MFILKYSLAVLAGSVCGLWSNGIASTQEITVPQASQQARKRIRAQRIDTPPVRDGLVNEPVWEQIEPATSFIQQEPNEGSAFGLVVTPRDTN